MKKKILVIIAVALAVCGIVAAVCYFLQRGGNDYAVVIPKDVSFISSVNLKNAGEKVNVDNASKIADKFGLPSSLKKYADDPEKIGIDPRCPVYTFLKDDNYAGVVLKTLDDDDFENFLNELSSKTSVIEKVQKKDGFNVANFGSSGVIVFNSDAILAIWPVKGGVDAFNTAKSLFKLQKEEQFIQTDEFKQLETEKNDIAANFYCGKLFDLSKQYGVNLPAIEGVDWSRCCEKMTCNFNDGAVVLNTNLFSADAETQKKLEAFASANLRKVDAKSLELIDNNTVFFATANMKGANLANLVDEVFSSNSELEHTIQSQNAKTMLAKLDDLLTAIDGNMALSVGTADDDEILLPVQLSFVADVKNADVLKDISYWSKYIDDYGAIKQENSQSYALSIEGTTMAKLGVEDNRLYLTTKSEPKKMWAKSPTDRTYEVMNDASASYGYAFFDIKKVMPAYDLLGNTMNLGMLDSFDCLSICNTTPLQLNAKLTFTNKKRNSLLSLIALL